MGSRDDLRVVQIVNTKTGLVEARVPEDEAEEKREEVIDRGKWTDGFKPDTIEIRRLDDE